MKQQHNISFNVTQSVLLMTIVASITKLANRYFELHEQLKSWTHNEKLFQHQFQHYKEVPLSKIIGWNFLLYLLLPVMAVVDYIGIAAFIDYMIATSNSMLIMFVLNVIGWLLFVLLEMGTTWIIMQYKDRPLVRTIGYLVAIVVALLPTVLIVMTYYLDPEPSTQLLIKTVILSALSLCTHALFLLFMQEVWNGIYYKIYCRKLKVMQRQSPKHTMQQVRHELVQNFLSFDNEAMDVVDDKKAKLLSNRAWYLKARLSNGNPEDDFDLSDYDAGTQYHSAPWQPL